jgi:inorganic pyrophosphatase
MRLASLTPGKGKNISVVLETPRGSHHKYAFDPEIQAFRLRKTLPLGAAFPFDFGFIPGTVGEDGDPLDVLILMEEFAYPGCVVECRVIGVLAAKQKEENGTEVRNDRIIAISLSSVLYKDVTKIQGLSKAIPGEIEEFFKYYNRQSGKEFKPIKFAGAEVAIKLIQDGVKKNKTEGGKN